MVICTQFLLTIARPFPLKKSRYYGLWLTSCSSLLLWLSDFFSLHTLRKTSPGKSNNLFPCNRHIYRMGSGAALDFCVAKHTSSVPIRPTM